MSRFFIKALLSLVIGGSASIAMAQAPTETVSPKTGVAAIVNGKQISEAAVQRALKPIAKESREKARKDIVNFLVENALIDHYLELLKITVEPKEIDTQLANFKKELAENKQDYAKVLEKMEIGEAELKLEIHNQLRWDKFTTSQTNEEKLKKLFAASPEIFDGTVVRAKHILVTSEDTEKKDSESALNKIRQVKAAIEKAIATESAKIAADADNLTKQKQINRITEEVFAAAAKEHSSCPSKRDGGDLGEFPRMGSMVEPFAKVAFTQKQYQLGDPVATQFGYHLILVTGRKGGDAVKFEQVKGLVSDVYASKLREAVVDKMKADPNTKIQIVK